MFQAIKPIFWFELCGLVFGILAFLSNLQTFEKARLWNDDLNRILYSPEFNKSALPKLWRIYNFTDDFDLKRLLSRNTYTELYTSGLLGGIIAQTIVHIVKGCQSKSIELNLSWYKIINASAGIWSLLAIVVLMNSVNADIQNAELFEHTIYQDFGIHWPCSYEGTSFFGNPENKISQFQQWGELGHHVCSGYSKPSTIVMLLFHLSACICASFCYANRKYRETTLPTTVANPSNSSQPSVDFRNSALPSVQMGTISDSPTLENTIENTTKDTHLNLEPPPSYNAAISITV